MSKQKRRTYVIDRAFQYRFIGTFLLSIIISLVLFSGGMVLYYWASSMAGDNLFKEFIDINKQVYEVEIAEDGTRTRVPTTETVYGVKRWELIVPPILINNLFMLIVISVIGVLYSHRIAGPIFRINRQLARVLDGEKGIHITLRKRDNLHDLAMRINALIRSYDALREKNDTTDVEQ
jgi:hypothetical protein